MPWDVEKLFSGALRDIDRNGLFKIRDACKILAMYDVEDEELLKAVNQELGRRADLETAE
jgi:hypothetical protein